MEIVFEAHWCYCTLGPLSEVTSSKVFSRKVKYLRKVKKKAQETSAALLPFEIHYSPKSYQLIPLSSKNYNSSSKSQRISLDL